MRTKQPATDLGVVFLLAGKKHGLGTNLFFLFFFFYNCSVRNRTAVVTKHLGLLSIRKKSKIEDQTENLARTTWSDKVGFAYSTMLVLRAAEGVATT